MDAIKITQRFAQSVAETYLKKGEPPLDEVVAVLCVNPIDPDDAQLWIGRPQDLSVDLRLRFPEPETSGVVHHIEDAVAKLFQIPSNGLLRVVVTTEEGIRLTVMSVYPRASA